MEDLVDSVHGLGVLEVEPFGFLGGEFVCGVSSDVDVEVVDRDCVNGLRSSAFAVDDLVDVGAEVFVDSISGQLVCEVLQDGFCQWHGVFPSVAWVWLG